MFDFLGVIFKQTVPNKVGTQVCFKMLLTQLAYTIEVEPQFPYTLFLLPANSSKAPIH